MKSYSQLLLSLYIWYIVNPAPYCAISVLSTVGSALLICYTIHHTRNRTPERKNTQHNPYRVMYTYTRERTFSRQSAHCQMIFIFLVNMVLWVVMGWHKQFLESHTGHWSIRTNNMLRLMSGEHSLSRLHIYRKTNAHTHLIWLYDGWATASQGMKYVCYV